VIAAELGRICSHLLAIGAMGMDIGAITPFTHALREREMINDLIEELCGARLTFNYMRIGGVAWDLPPGYGEKIDEYVDHLEPVIHELNDLLTFKQDLRRASGRRRGRLGRDGDRV
jgi:NADH-quinone oxidoreductase subunit D